MTGIVEVYKRWPTPEAATAHLEAVRWPDGPTCPYCGADRVSRHREAERARWQCQRCAKSFSVTVGTIFHGSHIDMQRWFLLISLVLSAKKGLSACQAARDLGMRRPTVWSMMHRIRQAMVDDGKLLAGLVEMDETYVGGKPRKNNRRDDDPPGGQGVTSKTPVVGAVERGGRVKMAATSKEEMAAGGASSTQDAPSNIAGRKAPAELREIYNRQMLDHPGADMPCPTCGGSGEIKTPYGWGDCHCRRKSYAE